MRQKEERPLGQRHCEQRGAQRAAAGCAMTPGKKYRGNIFSPLPPLRRRIAERMAQCGYNVSPCLPRNPAARIPAALRMTLAG